MVSFYPTIAPVPLFKDPFLKYYKKALISLQNLPFTSREKRSKRSILCSVNLFTVNLKQTTDEYSTAQVRDSTIR
jgi:hypothetical protein